MKILTLIFPLLSFFYAYTPADNCNEWQLKNNEGNFKVYMRDCEYSAIKEIRITDKFGGDFARVVTVMNDIETNKKISESCAEAKFLKHIDNNNSIQYFHYAMPFGVSDRDVVSKITFKKTDSTYSLVTEAVDNNLEKKKSGVIRITNARSSWYFKRTATGEIEMEYTAFADPNGIVPAWVVNSLARREARSSIEKLKKLIRG